MPEPIGGDSHILTDHEAGGELIKAQDKVLELQKKLKALARDSKLLRQQRDEAKNQLETYLSISRDTPLFKFGKPQGTRVDSQSIPILLWSDWHIEEEVKPETVRGLNKFNLDVADVRIERLVHKCVEYAKSREDETDIPGVVLWLGGDFFTGYIHEESLPSNLMSPPDAVHWVSQRLKAAIVYLSQNFPEVRVVCNVGNHGRTTKKKWLGNARRNNYEWLMYHQIADDLVGTAEEPDRKWFHKHLTGGRKLKNVTFHIPDSYFAEVDVFDRRIRFHHGDNMRYWGGVGGPSIAINKALREWDDAIPESVYVDYFGHLHRALDGYRWMMNPSLIGYSEIAIAMKCGYVPAMQSMDFIHNRVGRTDACKIHLQD